MAPGSDAASVLAFCRARGLRLATAESCTGGMIAAALTDIAGASDVVACGFVVYSNDAKCALLGVPAALIARVGAVSEDVARAMAEGALARGGVELAIAVTGIAGPGGATPTKPVGLVHLACACRGRLTTHRRVVLPGDRAAVRAAAVDAAFALILASPDDPGGDYSLSGSAGARIWHLSARGDPDESG